MHTTSERTAAIEKRTHEIRRQQQRRRNLLAAGLSAAACLALVVAAALAMPGLMAQQSGGMGGGSGAEAGVFAASGAAGYVVIGLLAFALGCCVTILCYRLRRRDREEHDGRDH